MPASQKNRYTKVTDLRWHFLLPFRVKSCGKCNNESLDKGKGRWKDGEMNLTKNDLKTLNVEAREGLWEILLFEARDTGIVEVSSDLRRRLQVP